jgi:hypothetical protein
MQGGYKCSRVKVLKWLTLVIYMKSVYCLIGLSFLFSGNRFLQRFSKFTKITFLKSEHSFYILHAYLVLWVIRNLGYYYNLTGRKDAAINGGQSAGLKIIVFTLSIYVGAACW